MSEKERQKKDGRDKNKKNQARREAEVNPPGQKQGRPRQEEGQSDAPARSG